ncbi:MAG: flagellar export protein FliJ [Bacteroidota bacterium]
MKFKFSLNSVLKVRSHKKKAEKNEMAKRVAEKQEIERQQDHLKEELNTYVQSIADEEHSTVRMMKVRSAHVQTKQQQINALDNEKKQAEDRVEEQRKKLSKAHQDLHVIEKAYDIEHKAFKDQSSKEEQKFLDEIATQSYKR